MCPIKPHILDNDKTCNANSVNICDSIVQGAKNTIYEIIKNCLSKRVTDSYYIMESPTTPFMEVPWSMVFLLIHQTPDMQLLKRSGATASSGGHRYDLPELKTNEPTCHCQLKMNK